MKEAPNSFLSAQIISMSSPPLKRYTFGQSAKHTERNQRVLKPGGTFLIVNEADGYGFLDNLYPKIIKGMTLYKTEELSAILTKAGFTNIEIDTKLGCVTVSRGVPSLPWIKVKTAVRFDNVRKWGRAALFAAGTAAAVCTAACLLKRIKAVSAKRCFPIRRDSVFT